MNKLLVVIGLLIFSQPALSAYSIKASAVTVDFNARMYEVCGAVKATAGETLGSLAIEIEVDPGRNSGHFVTHTNNSGLFCHLVRAYGSGIYVSVMAPASSNTPVPPRTSVKLP